MSSEEQITISCTPRRVAAFASVGSRRENKKLHQKQEINEGASTERDRGKDGSAVSRDLVRTGQRPAALVLDKLNSSTKQSLGRYISTPRLCCYIYFLRKKEKNASYTHPYHCSHTWTRIGILTTHTGCFTALLF